MCVKSHKRFAKLHALTNQVPRTLNINGRAYLNKYSIRFLTRLGKNREVR